MVPSDVELVEEGSQAEGWKLINTQLQRAKAEESPYADQALQQRFG